MGSFSIWHWLIVLVIVLLLFGRGKISQVMGDVAQGVKSFKRGMAEDDAAPNANRTVEHQPAEAVATPRTEDRRTPG